MTTNAGPGLCVPSVAAPDGSPGVVCAMWRDFVRMARDGMVAQELAVRDVMQPDVLCCGDDASVDEAAELMRVHRVRHVPVLAANEHIVGVVSIGDINAHRVGQCEVTLTQLENYVHRRA